MELGMTVRLAQVKEALQAWGRAGAEVRHVQFSGLSAQPLEDESRIVQAMEQIRREYPNAAFSAHGYKVNFAEKTLRIRNAWLDIAREEFELARRTGLLFLNFHLGWGTGGTRTAHEKYRNNLLPVLEEFAQLAEKTAVAMHLENLYPRPIHAEMRMLGDRPSDFQFWFSALQSPMLRLCYDCGHGNIDEYGLEILRQNRSRLGSIHAHDNDQMNDRHNALWDGTVGWEEIRRLVQGLPAPFILEQSPERQLKSVLRMREHGWPV